MQHILKCEACNKFTMKESCVCEAKTVPVKPAKYTPQDKYAQYRRQAKEAEWRVKGII